MTAVHTLPYKETRYTEPSKYPDVTLDYNFLVDKDVKFDSVDRDIKEFESAILMNSRFIDIYEGKGLPEGKKSMTFRFTIGSGDKTLSSEEIDDFSKSLLSHMESRGYILRTGT